MKKKIIGIAAVIAALAAGVFLYTVWNAKQAAGTAVSAFNTAVQEYNESIAPYNEAAAGIADANGKLQAVLDEAQAVLDKGEQAYEPDTMDELESSIQSASKAFAEVPAQIDPFEERNVPGSFSKNELALVQHEAETALGAVKEAKEKIPPVPEVPDFTDEIESVRSAQKKYEDSVQKLANITAPSDSFVKERLERIETVVQAEAVTADHDPNGLLGTEGGYTGCVYFLDERIDRSLLPQEAFENERKDDSESEIGEDGENSGEDSAGDSSENAASAEETAVGESAAENASAEKTVAGDSAADSTSAEVTAVGDSVAGSTSTEEAAAGNSAAGSTSAEETAAGDTSSEGTAAAGTAATAAEEAAAADGSADKKDKGIDVVMIGTRGGGAVEIFSTEEEAKKRMEYISFFDGSVMEAGSCTIEGTCLIRTSKYLDEEQQKELTEKIRQALLAVDE